MAVFSKPPRSDSGSSLHPLGAVCRSADLPQMTPVPLTQWTELSKSADIKYALLSLMNDASLELACKIALTAFDRCEDGKFSKTEDLAKVWTITVQLCPTL